MAASSKYRRPENLCRGTVPALSIEQRDTLRKPREHRIGHRPLVFAESCAKSIVALPDRAEAPSV
jgi:hypothetical protein